MSIANAKFVRGVLWLVLAAAMVGVTGAYVWSVMSGKKTEAVVSAAGTSADRLEVFGTIPDFEFPSHIGTSLSKKELEGSVWVAEYFFTTCAGICPKMNKNMTRVQEAFRGDPNVKIISFTVDPKTDTVSILRAYSKNWNAQDGQWYFLTGDKKALYALAREGFKLGLEERPPQDPGGPSDFIHSDRFVLVDRQGQIRGYYEGTSVESVGTLIGDIRRLLKEPTG